MVLSQQQTRHLLGRFPGAERRNLRPLTSTTPGRYKETAQGTFIARKEVASIIPAGGFAWFLEARIPENQGDTDAIALTGAEARRVFCWNPTDVALGWDQNFLVFPGSQNNNTPPVRWCIEGLKRRACIEPEVGPTSGHLGATTLLGTTPTLVPLTLIEDPGGRFTLEGDGSLTVNAAIPRMDVGSRVVVEFDFLTNNQAAEVELGFEYTPVSAATWFSVPAFFPFASSRAGIVQASVDFELFVDNAEPGDTLRMVGREVLGQAGVLTKADFGTWAVPQTPATFP